MEVVQDAPARISAIREQRPSASVQASARLTYTVEEVAEILGLSRSKTYELVARGEIPVVPLSGRRRVIARVTLDRLLGTDEQPRCR